MLVVLVVETKLLAVKLGPTTLLAHLPCQPAYFVLCTLLVLTFAGVYFCQLNSLSKQLFVDIYTC
jgi:hypothetical protein